MKFLFCFLIFLYGIHTISNGQEPIKRHTFSLHTGIVMEDGFLYAKSPPAIGLGYSYRLNKFLFLDASLISFYNTWDDVTVFGDEPFNIITRNSNSIFISQEDRDRITNVGIKDLSVQNSVKFLYLPLSISLNIRPIKIGRSSAGLAVGATATYGSYKASRDQIPLTITLKDGTVLETVPFLQEIEFRNLIIGGAYSKLYYKYNLGNSGKNAIQLSLHSYNFFWSPRNTYTYHLLTFDFHSSF